MHHQSHVSSANSIERKKNQEHVAKKGISSTQSLRLQVITTNHLLLSPQIDFSLITLTISPNENTSLFVVCDQIYKSQLTRVPSFQSEYHFGLKWNQSGRFSWF